MSSHFLLTLDTAPPASPALVINDGAASTGDLVATVKITSPSPDTREMIVWGDVDPTVDPLYDMDEADAQWQLYSPEVSLVLSSDAGPKHIYARLRDDVHNETVAFTSYIVLDTTSPVVAITTPVDRSRISLVDPFDDATFSWAANIDFQHYEVRVVPSGGSPHTAGVPLGSSHGSSNVSGNGAFVAGVPITTDINGADLQAASPGDTAKVVKVFVRSGGVWST